MFLYQKTGRFFGQTADEIKDAAVTELERLKAENIRQAYRGIYFNADMKTLYRINYTSRLLTRVLAPLAGFDCHSTKYLYNTAKEIPWKEIFSPAETFAVKATASNSSIRHSRYAALCLKDAIVDYFREKQGKRPDVDTVNANVWINLHIENNRATISLDTSGGSLHKRGYRKETVPAPMQETLAAAIIFLSGWNGSTALCDPMCGSGTILCEAAMHYCNIPSGFLRKNFGFESLPDFNPDLWRSVKKAADSRIRQLPKDLIAGSDKSASAVSAALKNIRMLPGGGNVRITAKDFRTIPNLENTTIICNPPYGVRTGTSEGMKAFYEDLGDFLKQNCKGSTAYIYFGDPILIKSIGLKTSWKKPLNNGGLEGRLVKIELY